MEQRGLRLIGGHLVINKIFFIAVFTFFIHTTAYATCNKSYTLGFFNGVWNTAREASDGKEALQDLVGSTYNNEPVKYENFYNHTGATVDSNGLQDLAETFIQRSAEIDASGEMGKRFEYFWEFLGSSKPTFLDKIKGIFPNAISLFDALYTTFTTKLAAIISGILSNPPTEADYATHNAQLDALAADGQKLMLVAHSQGNLFMNHAYDHILPVVTKNRVAAAHIAPASPTLHGEHVLTNIDLVINALRIQGVDSVPANNLDLNSSSDDVSGHTLIGTYLDGTRDGRVKVKTMIESAMEKLKCPLVLEYRQTYSTGPYNIFVNNQSFTFYNVMYVYDTFIRGWDTGGVWKPYIAFLDLLKYGNHPFDKNTMFIEDKIVYSLDNFVKKHQSELMGENGFTIYDVAYGPNYMSRDTVDIRLH